MKADAPPALPNALRDIAARLRRLPAYSHRNPHAWHEGRDELAAEIAALADGAAASQSAGCTPDPPHQLPKDLRPWRYGPDLPPGLRTFRESRTKDDGFAPAGPAIGPVPVTIVGTGPARMPTRMLPPGMHPDFTLGNFSGGFESPGLGTTGGFSSFPGHRAPSFESVPAHAVPVTSDLAGALRDTHATLDGPITAQVTGQGEVLVKVEFSGLQGLITAAATAAKATIPLTSVGGGGGASPRASTGSVGSSRVVPSPGGHVGHA